MCCRSHLIDGVPNDKVNGLEVDVEVPPKAKPPAEVSNAALDPIPLDPAATMLATVAGAVDPKLPKVGTVETVEVSALIDVGAIVGLAVNENAEGAVDAGAPSDKVGAGKVGVPPNDKEGTGANAAPPKVGPLVDGVPNEGVEANELLPAPNVGNVTAVVDVAGVAPTPPNEMEDVEGVPKPANPGVAADVVAPLTPPNEGAEAVRPNVGNAVVVEVVADRPKPKAGGFAAVVVEGVPNEKADPPVDPAPKLNPTEKKHISI